MSKTMDEGSASQTQRVFETLCESLDKNNIKYEKIEEKLMIKAIFVGDDLPMEILYRLDPKRELIILWSFLPFDVPEERRDAMAVAVACANHGLVDGSFDYDYPEGKVLFRITSRYRDSIISDDLLMFLLMKCCHIVDEYNDKFDQVCKSDMSLEEITDYIK